MIFSFVPSLTNSASQESGDENEEAGFKLSKWEVMDNESKMGE